MGEFLAFGYFLLGYFNFFYLNRQFQNTVCCTYFNIQKQFDATIFDFQFELCNLATVLATFLKIGLLFSNFWSLWSEANPLAYFVAA